MVGSSGHNRRHSTSRQHNVVDLDTVGERTREKGELGWGKNDKEPLALALPLAAFLSLHFLFFTQSLFFSHARDLSRPRPSSLHIVISFHPYIILSPILSV